MGKQGLGGKTPLTDPRVRFGHAFPNPRDKEAPDPVKEIWDILMNNEALGPREPTDLGTVSKAERLLGIKPNKRPVYAYVGCLHEELGSIGLVITPEWFGKDAQGVSRCDTGGLIGKKGGFAHLEDEEAEKALNTLSHHPSYNWEEELHQEVESAFGGWPDYLRGNTPNAEAYNDVRKQCIKKSGTKLDRRLWTWEVRNFEAISAKHLEAVVLNNDSLKEFRDRFGDGPVSVDIRFLPGGDGPEGTHWFQEEKVVCAFLGKAM